MALKWNIKNYSKVMLSLTQEVPKKNRMKTRNALENVAEKIADDMREFAPVDRGGLRKSIQVLSKVKIIGDRYSIDVGSKRPVKATPNPVMPQWSGHDYANYPNEGTGVFRGGRNKWKYYNPRLQKWVTTSGYKGSFFVEKAYNKNKKNIARLFKTRYKRF